MGFDCETVNLDSIAKDSANEKITLMNRITLDMLFTGEADKVFYRGKKYFVTLEPVFPKDEEEASSSALRASSQTPETFF